MNHIKHWSTGAFLVFPVPLLYAFLPGQETATDWSLSYLHLQQEFHQATSLTPFRAVFNNISNKSTPKFWQTTCLNFSPKKLSCTSTRLANVVCIYTISSALDASFMPFLASFCPILTCSASLLPGVDPWLKASAAPWGTIGRSKPWSKDQQGKPAFF